MHGFSYTAHCSCIRDSHLAQRVNVPTAERWFIILWWLLLHSTFKHCLCVCTISFNTLPGLQVVLANPTVWRLGLEEKCFYKSIFQLRMSLSDTDRIWNMCLMEKVWTCVLRGSCVGLNLSNHVQRHFEGGWVAKDNSLTANIMISPASCTYCVLHTHCKLLRQRYTDRH